jgi:hypothetical protein
MVLRITCTVRDKIGKEQIGTKCRKRLKSAERVRNEQTGKTVSSRKSALK